MAKPRAGGIRAVAGSPRPRANVAVQWWDKGMTTSRLIAPPAPSEPPNLDAAQRAVVAHVADSRAGHVVVVGEAGSGKTAVAVALAAAEVQERRVKPEDVLVLAPTRQGAESLRDRVSFAMGVPTGVPSVRTPASAAFSILLARAETDGMPRPVLVSGADQDAILRALLDGHQRGLGAQPNWDGVVPAKATALPGFRHELRDLLMRAVEAGVGPGQLADAGRTAGRPEWVGAAAVYAEYEQVMALRSLPGDQGSRYDPAGVVAAAADLLEDWPAGGVRKPSWKLVVADDAQDATAATWALISALVDGGARLVAIGNADESVQGYRGAVPFRLARALAPEPAGGFGASLLRLGESHRQPTGLAALARTVASRIPVSEEGSARRPSDGANGAAVEVIVAPQRRAQSRAIAARLRALNLGFDGARVPWSRMAVIARTSEQLRALRGDLVAAEIPCEFAGDGVALRDEPAVAPLLTMLNVAVGTSWTADAAAAVLSSRLVGLDAVALRRLRRALVREDRDGGGTRAADQLLAEAMQDPARLVTVAGAEASRAALASRAAWAGARAAASVNATPGAILWAIWSRFGLAEVWRAGALAGSARDDADMDAVIALMRAAQQYSERMPEASPAEFGNYVAAQEFAADSLAARARGGDAVAFVTPVHAAGQEWDVVVVCGLEEGVWPNLRLRDSVLGAQAFADVVAGRAPRAPAGEASRPELAAGARAAVFADETRALLVALTRARVQLIVSCLDGEDERPSRYISWIEAATGADRQQASDIRGVADLRDAVVELRRAAAELTPAKRAGQAHMLARLALAGAPGADPRWWHGAHPWSTDGVLWGANQRVRVSPSRVDAVEQCPLRWSLESVGGSAESGSAQVLGNVVHEVAAAHPTGSAEDLEQALDERWHQIGTLDTWVGRHERERASRMARHLAAYFSGVRADQVLTELPFRVELGRATLSGQADRVHVTGSEAVIVDIKTGKQAVPGGEVAEHGQLAMYQLAANHGGLDGVTAATGAELVFVGTAAAKVPDRKQGPIDDQATLVRLAAVVQTMSAAGFDATPGDHCDRCPLRRCCPAQPEGAQVSAR